MSKVGFCLPSKFAVVLQNHEDEKNLSGFFAVDVRLSASLLFVEVRKKPLRFSFPGFDNPSNLEDKEKIR